MGETEKAKLPLFMVQRIPVKHCITKATPPKGILNRLMDFFARELKKPDDPNNHLDILAQLLPRNLYRSLLSGLSCQVYTDCGFSILHRWALNQPENLKRLLCERKGLRVLLFELYLQQEMEARTPPPFFRLEDWSPSDANWVTHRRRMDDREILESALRTLSR